MGLQLLLNLISWDYTCKIQAEHKKIRKITQLRHPLKFLPSNQATVDPHMEYNF